MASRKLTRPLYAQPTLKVARQLIGKRLVRRIGGRRLAGIIVETEAYMGPTDVASHSRHGEQSRAAPMFGKPGYAYIYFTYGMHHCFNVVTEPPGSGTAVLIRALEPTEGLALMRRHRQTGNEREITDHELTNGPGKLCQALALDRTLNRTDLLSNVLWLEEGIKVHPGQVGTSARVGIREGREHPWRFYLKDSRFISRHPNY